MTKIRICLPDIVNTDQKEIFRAVVAIEKHHLTSFLLLHAFMNLKLDRMLIIYLNTSQQFVWQKIHFAKCFRLCQRCVFPAV